MVSTLIHAAITGVGFYAVDKKITSRSECIAAINRYWGYYADPNILRNKNYRQLKYHMEQTSSHIDDTIESCRIYLNKEDVAMLAAPLRDHFSTKINDIYENSLCQHTDIIVSIINDIVLNRRAISMLHHIRPVKNQYCFQDPSAKKISKLPRLISELLNDTNKDYWAKARLYTMMLSSEMEILINTCKTSLILTTNDPNLLLAAFYSAKQIMKQSQKRDTLSTDDDFSIKNLKNNQIKTVASFKQLWQLRDPETYLQYINAI